MKTRTDSSHAGETTSWVENRISGGIFLHAVVQGRDITVQLPPAIAPALSGLPAPSSVFSGRDDLVARLLQELAPDRSNNLEDAADGPTAVVTVLSGLAGIGKTELAVQTAAHALKRPGWFPGGVLFADLFGYDPDRRVSPKKALGGFLRALGIPNEHIPAKLPDRERLYRSVLAAHADEGRRILVIVDNASSVRQAQPLLPTNGVTACLVTSRHTLDGLEARLRDIDDLDCHSSMTLLDRALRLARGSNDTRISGSPNAAENIARLCSGLPLALRIAAAALAADPQRPAEDLAAALAAEHTRLDKLARPDRALRAAFDLSYRLLDTDAARLFRLLPLNPGPDISAAAAASLIDGTVEGASELLQHLFDAHLVKAGLALGRRGMHDLVHLYAGECGRIHAETDQRDAALARVLAYYENTAAAADTHFGTMGLFPADPRFADLEEALAWLEFEHPCLVAAATTAHSLGYPSTTTMLALALGRYLGHFRLFEELITVTTTALPCFRATSDRRGEGGALINLGLALAEVRRFEEAISALLAAAVLISEIGEPYGEAAVLNNLGLVLQKVRQFPAARKAFRKAAGIFRATGARFDEAMALNSLGCALREEHRFDKAIKAHMRAADVFRQISDRHGEGRTLSNIGIALLGLNRCDEALDAYSKAIEIFRENRDRHSEGLALNNCGLVLRRVGRPGDAADAHTRALGIFRAGNDHHMEAQTLSNLGLDLCELNRFNEAIDAQMKAARLFRQTNDRHGEGQALNNLGTAQRMQGSSEAAIDAHMKALDLFREVRDRHSEAIALGNLGKALHDLEQFDEAIDAQMKAARLFRKVRNRSGEGQALNDLGAARIETGNLDGAISAFRESAEVHNNSGDWQAAVTPVANLVRVMVQAGRRSEGVELLRQVVETYARQLPASDQESEPDLGYAKALLTLAWFSTGKPGMPILPGALRAAEGAAALYRRLAAAEPAVFTDSWCTSLVLQAELLKRLGHWNAHWDGTTQNGTSPMAIASHQPGPTPETTAPSPAAPARADSIVRPNGKTASRS